MIRFASALVLASLFTILTPSVSPQSSLPARDLWEKAIEAKGGREQLYKVKALRLWYNETTRNFLGIAIHRGLVTRLYVFPGKVWAWDDGLPAPFHLSVSWVDIDQDKRCTQYEGAVRPVCGPPRQGTSLPEGISQAQYLYLMESQWVKPQPVDVHTDYVGRNKVDVVRTSFENKRIDYFLDRQKHLPVRIDVFYNNSQRATLSVEFSNYVVVDGVQMPTKQKDARINFEINPSYDSTIFDAPPSIAAGPDAWKRPTH